MKIEYLWMSRLPVMTSFKQSRVLTELKSMNATGGETINCPTDESN